MAYRTSEAAEMLGVSRWTVTRLVAMGELDGVRLPPPSGSKGVGRLLIPAASLARFLERNAVVRNAG
jgi:excisionase family DNA binding protein